jgi:hypothetical protein
VRNGKEAFAARREEEVAGLPDPRDGVATALGIPSRVPLGHGATNPGGPILRRSGDLHIRRPGSVTFNLCDRFGPVTRVAEATCVECLTVLAGDDVEAGERLAELVAARLAEREDSPEVESCRYRWADADGVEHSCTLPFKHDFADLARSHYDRRTGASILQAPSL